ncbi:hypothetical protein NQ317_004770, partial [Molorchus minor]
VTATPPLSLLAEERTYLYETQNGHQPEIRQVARERTIRRWQTEWEENTVTAQWTKRLIPVLDGWVKCKHRSTDYFLTQALTGHGPFRSYRTRIGKIEDERCLHCGTVDTVEHTLFECNRWEIYRQETYGELGLEISAENMTREMTASESKWKIIQRMVNKILREKEQEERGRAGHAWEKDTLRVVESVILYAAPVWYMALDIHRNLEDCRACKKSPAKGRKRLSDNIHWGN